MHGSERGDEERRRGGGAAVAGEAEGRREGGAAVAGVAGSGKVQETKFPGTERVHAHAHLIVTFPSLRSLSELLFIALHISPIIRQVRYLLGFIFLQNIEKGISWTKT